MGRDGFFLSVNFQSRGMKTCLTTPTSELSPTRKCWRRAECQAVLLADCSDGGMETLFAPNCDLVISVLQRLGAQALWPSTPTPSWVAALPPQACPFVSPWAARARQIQARGTSTRARGGGDNSTSRLLPSQEHLLQAHHDR